MEAAAAPAELVPKKELRVSAKEFSPYLPHLENSPNINSVFKSIQTTILFATFSSTYWNYCNNMVQSITKFSVWVICRIIYDKNEKCYRAYMLIAPLKEARDNPKSGLFRAFPGIYEIQLPYLLALMLEMKTLLPSEFFYVSAIPLCEFLCQNNHLSLALPTQHRIDIVRTIAPEIYTREWSGRRIPTLKYFFDREDYYKMDLRVCFPRYMFGGEAYAGGDDRFYLFHLNKDILASNLT